MPDWSSELANTNILLQSSGAYIGCLLAFKGLHGLAPGCLAELLVHSRPQMALRSTSENKLVMPRTFLKTYGDRALYYAASKLWNSLPRHLRLCDCLVTFKAGHESIRKLFDMLNAFHKAFQWKE